MFKVPQISSKLISLAHIIRVWGVKGEVKALPLSKLFDLITPGCDVVLISEDAVRTVRTVRTIRRMPKDAAIAFEGIDDRDKAARLRRAVIAIERSLIPPLPDGEYLVDDLQGLSVRTTGGEVIGILEEVFATGGNDVYIVRNRGREYLIPAIIDVVREIDLDKRTMVISPMEGLLDQA